MAAAAVGIFIATFNADLYRPLVVSKLQEALGGVPVKLERISLGWRGGIVLRLKRLAIYPEPKGIYTDLAARAEPSLQIEEIMLLVRPMPLLKKRLEIASVALIRPHLRLARGAGGAFQMEGVPFPPGKKPSAVPDSSSAAGGSPPPAVLPPAKKSSLGSLEMPSLAVDRVEVEQGVLRVSDPNLKPPAEWLIEQVDLEAGIREDRVDLKKLSGQIGDGKVLISGKAENLKSEPKIQFKVTAEKLPLVKLLPAPEAEPHLTGELSGSFQGTVQGRNANAISKSFSGDGKIQVTHPVLVNLNVLQEVFKRISIIPGLVDLLQSRLPVSYREKLNARDTVFESIDLTANVAQGALLFENLRLASDTFALAGGGRLGMDGTISSQMQLKISPELSAAIIQSVKEFQALTGSDGRVEFPVRVEGTLPRVNILPDVSYLASHMIVNKVEDLLGGLLEKALEKKSK